MKHFKKLILLFIAVLFFLTDLSAQNNDEITVITITNARETSYKKDEETGNDSIFLEGSVSLSVQKGSSVSEINAQKVVYDRKTQMLYAEGNVEIQTKSSATGGEKITAGSLIMNTSTLEGIFDDGRVTQTQSDAINLPSGSTLVVFSDIFGKSENNTIVFKNSSLTFCDDENPHWRIDASRTWLLPGGEFAFLNALLYVGEVPVFYFPAFYYPKDELIFNPAFGYRNREGYFIQTTYYLIGRKPLESSTSSSSSADKDSGKALYNFMKPNTLKQQERQGLVLHNLDEDFKGDSSKYLKLMGDWYSNLGGMIGLDGKLDSKSSYFGNINFNLKLGFSNTIFYDAGYYIGLSHQNNTYYDHSNFLGLKMPFRYGANLEVSLIKPFNLSISIPLYSDPYFNYDFNNRQESMDWISFLMAPNTTTIPTVSEITSFTWKINGSYSIPLSETIRPYISSANLSVTSSIDISTDTNEGLRDDERYKDPQWLSYSPERKYFYPSQIIPLSANLSVSGTLYSWPKKSSSSNKANYDVSLNVPQEFATEEAANQNTENKEKTSAEKKSAEISEEKTEEQLRPVLPVLSVPYVNVQNVSGITYNLGYTFNPSLQTQFSYDHSNFQKPEDFEWTNIKSSMYSVKAPLTLDSSLTYGGNFLSLNNKVFYNPVWQGHPEYNGKTAAELESIKVADYKAQAQDIISTNSLSIKPFAYLPAFAQTGITWNTSLKLFRKVYTGTESDLPDWDYFGPDWTDADCVTEHSLNFTFAANQKDGKFSQTLVFSSILAPQVPKFTGSLNLKFPYVNSSFSAGIHQKSLTDKTWEKNPFQESVSVSLFDSKLSLSQSYSYNFEENSSESFRLSASYNGLQAAFVMSNTYGYDFNPSEGWKIKDHKEFLPHSFTFSYNPKSINYYAWFNRVSIGAGLSTSVVADLVRPTNSYFVFTPTLSLKIHEFLTISFSSTSRNSVIYRYFQSANNSGVRIPGEENIFVDLFNSFRFDKEELRRSSGFKLKSLNFSLQHELHDWNMNMTLKFEPRLITKGGKKYYNYDPYFSLGIVWKPMESIKTQITDEYGDWKFE